MLPPVSLHSHRLDNNASKLPTFRHADLNLTTANKSAVPAAAQAGLTMLWPSSETAPSAPCSPSDPEQNEIVQKKHVINKKVHVRTYSETAVQQHLLKNEESPAPEKPRPVTSSGPVESVTGSDNTPGSSTTHPILTRAKARKDPARDSRGRHPPLAMLNGPQKYFQTVTVLTENKNNPTEDWVANQSVLTTSPLDDRKPQPLQSPSSQPVTPSIPPIRSFKSSRRSIDAPSPRTAMDHDDTVRGLDGFNSRHPLNREQEEQSSDDSDLFLKLAREESAGSNRSGVIRRVSIDVLRRWRKAFARRSLCIQNTNVSYSHRYLLLIASLFHPNIPFFKVQHYAAGDQTRRARQHRDMGTIICHRLWTTDLLPERLLQGKGHQQC